MRNMSKFIAMMILICSPVLFVGFSSAEEQVNGTVKSIDLTTNTVVVTSYEGAEVTLTVEDELTLNKLKGRKIRVDDDVKVKYEKVGGKNVSTYFIRPAGC